MRLAERLHQELETEQHRQLANCRPDVGLRLNHGAPECVMLLDVVNRRGERASVQIAQPEQGRPYAWVEGGTFIDLDPTQPVMRSVLEHMYGLV